MGIGITAIGGMFCGFLGNHIDLAPNFAGTLMALTNTAATLPGIIVPVFVGQITHGNVSEGEKKGEKERERKMKLTFVSSRLTANDQRVASDLLRDDCTVCR